MAVDARLEAGPEMDAAIARLLGHTVIELGEGDWRVYVDNTGTHVGGFSDNKYVIECEVPKWGLVRVLPTDGKPVMAVPSYSTDIEAAWQIIGVFRERPFSDRHRFGVVLKRIITDRVDVNKQVPDGHTLDWPTILLDLKPEDICRAMLAADEEGGDQ